MPYRYYTPYTVNEPPIHPPEASKFTWTSPAGRVTELSNFDDLESGVFVPPGAIGLGVAPKQFFETNSPVFDGGSVHGHRTETRDISLPIHIYGHNRLAFLELWQRLVDDFRPDAVRGPGTLTLTQFNGKARSIKAYYNGGFEGQDDDREWGSNWVSTVLRLRCHNPHWYGDAVTQTFATPGNGQVDPDPTDPTDPGGGGGGNTGLFFPILPLILAGGLPTTQTPVPEPEPEQPGTVLSAVGDLIINYTGNELGRPIWTFTGPCDSIRLTNKATGRYFEITGGVVAGRQLVIDTGPARTVTENVPGSSGLPDGTGDGTTNSTINRFGDVIGDLWPLVAGTNIVAISAPGIATDSNLKVTWQPQYSTGY